MLTYNMHMKRFHIALSDAMQASGMPLKQVCETAGVSYEQFKKYMQRAKVDPNVSTNVDTAIKIAHVFGMTFDEFVGDDTALVRTEAVDLWRKLSEGERQILLAAARGKTS
ncbi:hypothetical protein SAMN04488032_1278 [Pacificibacter marinus]|uniref:HTH cro/C1-type domain-containing protein n=2 Tax=Pacificibacter marinus TaxID=658057 RepID=A0A1Y5TWN5_9RHOB|nr:hypothetical protein SAMN04488032_1278 [Pacificibacter marinus]SLN71754.1 hypothetical protein PAM7971_03842 [Pacificibacter marinus]